MANEEHVARLKQGVDAWNEWRKANPEVKPDLEGESLTGVHLAGAILKEVNLAGAFLDRAYLKEAILTLANLEEAHLEGSNLGGANLQGAKLGRANLRWARLKQAILFDSKLDQAALSSANFEGAGLSRASLKGASLSEASLKGALLDEANFEGAELRHANLKGADLRGATLSEANLWKVNLEGAYLDNAKLEGANLKEANLSKAKLEGANLSGANLSEVNISEANLSGANLSEVNLSGANLSGANLSGANLSEANLKGANLERAKLPEANLDGVNLKRANLTDAELSGVLGLEVDSCRIVHTRFSPRASDHWSVLRRTYTGPKMVINLLFVALFFIPLIGKGAALWGLTEIQHPLVDAINSELAASGAPDEAKQISVSVMCDLPEGGSIVVSIPPREVRVGDIVAAIPGVERRIRCRSMPMWQLLLGYGGPLGIWMPVLTGLLILYQVLRFLMTNQVSLIRDAEERSGISPSKEGLLSYPNLYRIHQVLSVVFLVALATFAVRAAEFLTSDVILRLGDGSSL